MANSFISTLPAPNPFPVDSFVKYYTTSGSSPLSGLSNSQIYAVSFSNSSGFCIATGIGGANIEIPGIDFPSEGHNFRGYQNPFDDSEKVVYTTPSGNTALSGLSNNALYYIVSSNAVGFSLASVSGGPAINITANSTGGQDHYIATVAGYLPGDRVYQNITTTFNALSSVNSTTDFISLSPQPYSTGDNVLYYTSTGNTVISGLSNSSYYYVSFANSTGIKLSLTQGGAAINIASGISQTGHNILSIANAQIYSVFIDETTGKNYVRIQDRTNSFASGFTLASYTNPYIGELVGNVSPYSVVSTAKGVVKSGANSTAIKVKRLTFENTFKAGEYIVGDTSGSSARIVSVVEDNNTYPIGLNASVEANVVTANGQISSLTVSDSGYGYSNSEIIQFTSEDGLRSGSIKLITSGIGTGSGYYKSTRGFLSSDMKIHDGDYYQEYSYEILSKLSFSKYEDMFKKVMHTAGTKLFGSSVVSEVASLESAIISSMSLPEIAFDSNDDVDTFSDQINLRVSGVFSNGDSVRYYTASGNTVVDGLSNNSVYKVTNTSDTYIKLANTSTGTTINIASALTSEVGHYIVLQEE